MRGVRFINWVIHDLYIEFVYDSDKIEQEFRKESKLFDLTEGEQILIFYVGKSLFRIVKICSV